MSLVSEDVRIINVRSMSTMKKTGTCRHHWASTCFSKTTQQGTQLNRHTCLQHLTWITITSNEKYVHDCTCVLSPSRVSGLKKNHLTYTSLRQNCTTTQQPPGIREQLKTAIAQLLFKWELILSTGHLTEIRWVTGSGLFSFVVLQNSPILAQNLKCSFIFYCLVSSDWWSSCPRKTWPSVESLPGVGPGQGLFSRGHHNFSFSGVYRISALAATDFLETSFSSTLIFISQTRSRGCDTAGKPGRYRVQWHKLPFHSKLW